MRARRARLRGGLGRALLCAGALAVAGCGFGVQEADLWLLTRTGPGPKLTILVNSDGTVTCDGRAGKPLSSSLLIQARDLQANLHYDAARKLRIPRSPRSVYMYRVTVDSGTITFPDTAAASHPSLASLELLTVQAAHSSCGLS